MTVLSDPYIMTRQDVINQYQTCLQQGILTSNEIQNFLNGKQRHDLIIQQSSGSSSLPLNIPRTTADINDIAMRVLTPYIKHYGIEPVRIALLGGISHSESAIKLQLKNSIIRYFTLDEYKLLDQFQPELISCYPSVMRELLSNPNLCLNAVKAFKVGGETLFPSDIKKIFSRWPNFLIIEQYGLTERV
ncbi:MAG: long-chain fatty acid--CoA ligase [Gammaproteobacteria bacterium]|nr:long-chain fatty acid--CoA ligase [Gammaproteobacteria bacterium]